MLVTDATETSLKRMNTLIKALALAFDSLFRWDLLTVHRPGIGAGHAELADGCGCRQGRRAESVFADSVVGGTGHWPVRSGDPPDAMPPPVRANRDGLVPLLLRRAGVGGSPTGTGGSPVPPTFSNTL